MRAERSRRRAGTRGSDRLIRDRLIGFKNVLYPTAFSLAKLYPRPCRFVFVINLALRTPSIFIDDSRTAAHPPTEI